MTLGEGPNDFARAQSKATSGASSPTAERWRVIQSVVDGALDRPPAERTAYLSQACGSDAALYASASRLLDACDRAARLDTVFGGRAADFAAPMLAELAGREAPRTPTQRADLADALRSALSPHYAVERELGRGGMATVYLARDLRHDRTVAVKVLDRNVAVAGAERFLHEIRIAARLTHPHVLGVHDSGDANGLLFYVMPYVDGETLRARLAREGALPVADGTRIIRELADALAYAHGRGVMHRDLKPENVLLSGGHAVVADFGIAKAIAAATQDGTGSSAGLTSAGVALGTPAYMAPEQAIGDPAIDHRADLYALGVVAYEMLAGTHPFGGRAPQALVAAHLTESPVPLEERRRDLAPRLVALVMRLLAKHPSHRPQNAEEVLRALDGISGPTLEPVPADTAAKVPTKRARGVTAGVATAWLLVAGAVGFFAWRGGLERGGRGEVASLASSPGGPVAIRTLAVLPFENTGGVATDDYFSDGMTDELAHALARIPGLRLAGRTSSYTFKGKNAPAQEIGRALGVDAIVNGTVRRAGDRLRLTAQLVSTSDGTVLRDSIFEGGSGDVFAVQDELTRAIVAALAPALGDRASRAVTADATRGTTEQEAYDLYLKGRYHFLARGAENMPRAIAYFREAVRRDPEFARAHAGLALAYGILPVYVPDPADSTTALMSASAERAVALDSTLADAQVALALALEAQLRLAEAERRYRIALTLEPSNATAHHVFGFLLHSIGRTDEAVLHLQQAARLDPLAKSAGASAAAALVAARRFPEALVEAHRVLALDSTFSLSILSLGVAQAFGGQTDSAVRTLERGVQLHPDLLGQHAILVYAYAASGRWADAERVRTQLRRQGGSIDGGVATALADLVFGDREPALRLLATESGRRRWYAGVGFGCHPMLDPLWVDARFRAAMRAFGVEPCPLARPWHLPPRV